jgi:4-hydroxy-3-methylbut-2-en-1-yl diphosphate reductase
VASYHIDSADRIGLDNTIEHKPLDRDLEIQTDWLPAGKLTIGVTSGASTPDKAVEASIEKILAIKSDVSRDVVMSS